MSKRNLVKHKPDCFILINLLQVYIKNNLIYQVFMREEGIFSMVSTLSERHSITFLYDKKLQTHAKSTYILTCMYVLYQIVHARCLFMFI